MVAVLLIVLAAVLVVVIGFVFVGSAVGKTEAMPAQVVFDVHEAIDFVAEAVPVEVSSVLSFDDVRRLLRFHLEWLQAYHWAPDTEGEAPIVFEEFDALDYVMERCDITGFEVERPHAAAVIEAHTAYLQVMGAIHVDDPVDVERDLASLPLLDAPRQPAELTEPELASDASDLVSDFEDQEEGGGPTD